MLQPALGGLAGAARLPGPPSSWTHPPLDHPPALPTLPPAPAGGQAGALWRLLRPLQLPPGHDRRRGAAVRAAGRAPASAAGGSVPPQLPGSSPVLDLRPVDDRNRRGGVGWGGVGWGGVGWGGVGWGGSTGGCCVTLWGWTLESGGKQLQQSAAGWEGGCRPALGPSGSRHDVSEGSRRPWCLQT